MATTTRLSFTQLMDLPEAEGIFHELDEGEPLTEASPTLRNNLIRQVIARAMREFIEGANRGLVV
jgi:hypothetical protein